MCLLLVVLSKASIVGGLWKSFNKNVDERIPKIEVCQLMVHAFSRATWVFMNETGLYVKNQPYRRFQFSKRSYQNCLGVTKSLELGLVAYWNILT